MSFLAIDPGRDTGWAFFGNIRLTSCGLGLPWHHVPGSDFVIIELPQVYRAAQSKGDPNDLIKVAVQVGEHKRHYEQRGAQVRLVLPADWKGQVPKDIHHARIWSKLDAKEQEIVNEAGKGIAPSKRHNMLDAVALGLFGLNRTRVGGA